MPKIVSSVSFIDMQDFQLHLIHADYLGISKQWNARNVCSTFWRFYINNRDGAAIWWQEGKYPLPARQIHLIPPYLQFSCQNTQDIQHLYVHFDLLGLPPILQQQSLVRPCSLPLTPSARKLCGLYAAGQLPEASPAALCLTHGVVMEALGSVIAKLPEESQVRLQIFLQAPNPLRPAMQLIEQRLPLPVPVSQLAASCGLSSDHLIRKFKHLMGQTPGRYMLQRRNSLAARCLLYTQDTIEQIAHEHGFANRFHFTRSFKTQMGITPAAFRTSQRV